MDNHDIIFFVFFFQAEDGIRDLTVTGVQTCALPISFRHRITELAAHLMRRATSFRDNSARRSFSARLRRSDSKSAEPLDRKSTRLNSSHSQMSYAVFCLKKKVPALAGCVPSTLLSCA